MCVYTGKCSDLVDIRDRLIYKKKELSNHHPKISFAIDSILNDMIDFMQAAINHIEYLEVVLPIRHKSPKEIEFESWYEKNKDVYINKVDIAKAAYFKKAGE